MSPLDPFRIGLAFLIHSESPTKHIWVVLSDPTADAEQVLLVSFTTLQAWQDRSCLLVEGDHPRVKHPTCIAYRNARVYTLAKLEALRDSHGLEPREPVSEELLNRMLRGAQESPFLALCHLKILTDQGLVDGAADD